MCAGNSRLLSAVQNVSNHIHTTSRAEMYYVVVTARGLNTTRRAANTHTHTSERRPKECGVWGGSRRTCSARVRVYLRFSRGGLETRLRPHRVGDEVANQVPD